MKLFRIKLLAELSKYYNMSCTLKELTLTLKQVTVTHVSRRYGSLSDADVPIETRRKYISPHHFQTIPYMDN